MKGLDEATRLVGTIRRQHQITIQRLTKLEESLGYDPEVQEVPTENTTPFRSFLKLFGFGRTRDVG